MQTTQTTDSEKKRDESAVVRTEFLGRRGYREMVTLQEDARQRVFAGGEESLFLLEHDPVVTCGRAARREHILVSEAQLAARGIDLVDSSRGGDVTYHGPGQLVVYPVVQLRKGVVQHVTELAESVIQLLSRRGIAAVFRRDNPGVWVSTEAGDAKVAAVGVHVHRRVAIHGLALNVSTAMAPYSLIVPCGLSQSRVTSMKELTGHAPAIDLLAHEFAEIYAAVSGRSLRFAPASAPPSALA